MDTSLISIEEAQKILLDFVESRSDEWPTERVSASKVVGRVLSESIVASVSVPHFDNSAMDGFALRAQDTQSAKEDAPLKLKVVGEIVAGQDPSPLCKKNTAFSIMTGAAIPKGADAVIEKEAVTEVGNEVVLKEPVEEGRYIRRVAEDVAKGDEVVPAGTRVSVGVAAVLASLGVRSARVGKRPQVAVLVTGRELVSTPKELTPGKIIESNSILLANGLREMGIDPEPLVLVGDNPEVLYQKARLVLEDSDLVLISGGVSVGEHDHTKEVCDQLGVEKLFWRVNQKPGKPLYAGKKGNCLVMGLPGNPYSVFVAFYMYVRPVLLALMGDKNPELFRQTLPLAQDVKKSDERAQWLKGQVVSDKGQALAKPLGRQESHLLTSLIDANALILLPAGKLQWRQGEDVQVVFLLS